MHPLIVGGVKADNNAGIVVHHRGTENTEKNRLGERYTRVRFGSINITSQLLTLIGFLCVLCVSVVNDAGEPSNNSPSLRASSARHRSDIRHRVAASLHHRPMTSIFRFLSLGD